MPAQLKATYIHLLTTTIIFGVYAWCIFGVFGIEYFTGTDALVRIGKAILILIVAGYAFEIPIVMGTLSLGHKLSKKLENDWTVDEMDKTIYYRSMVGSHIVLCAGLFLSIGGLAFGLEPFWVFNAMVLAFLLSIITELCIKLFLYKQGC